MVVVKGGGSDASPPRRHLDRWEELAQAERNATAEAVAEIEREADVKVRTIVEHAAASVSEK